MTDILREKIREAYLQIQASEGMFEEGIKGLLIAVKTIETCEDILRENGLSNLPLSDEPITEHRRYHRSGRPAKIDGDPELRAFILARIDRMTFVDLAQEIAQHFPKSRRIGKSAIHAWNKKRKMQ